MSYLASSVSLRTVTGSKIQSTSGRKMSRVVVDLTAFDYARLIADALDTDYGKLPSKIKTIQEDTGAAEGTVKNWCAGVNGPGGEMLIKLLAVSPAVRRAVDTMSRRDDALAQAEARLHRIVRIMKGEEP